MSGRLVRAGPGKRVAEAAEAVARSITNPYQEPAVLAAVAEASACAGQYDQAEPLARSSANPGWRL